MGLYDGMNVSLAGKVEKLVKKDAKTRFIDAIEKQIKIAAGDDTKQGAFLVKSWKKKSGIIEIKVLDILIDRIASTGVDYITFLEHLKSNIENGRQKMNLLSYNLIWTLATKERAKGKN